MIKQEKIEHSFMRSFSLEIFTSFSLKLYFADSFNLILFSYIYENCEW